MDSAAERSCSDLGLPPIRALAAHGSIAQSLQTVESLRAARLADVRLQVQTQALRSWQSSRFRQTYADLMPDPQMGPAARFFLTELYSDQECSCRDAQFARIASTIERIFPQPVVHTATLLAQLHALSETLDACMARGLVHWFAHADALAFGQSDSDHAYTRTWRGLCALGAYRRARQDQLDAAHALGLALEQHTKVPGLRLLLKMMRGPATAAGLQDLQRFLEIGFDTFGALSRAGLVPHFLGLTDQRERGWMAQLDSSALQDARQ